ncbi:hypothetical protein [Streptomyces sp. NPDC048428]|uniref:hypothetical protein n=1 Tax=Streptomyces sp. NPDC048428 TaxID=3154503 RepID=UPI003431A1C7
MAATIREVASAAGVTALCTCRSMLAPPRVRRLERSSELQPDEEGATDVADTCAFFAVLGQRHARLVPPAGDGRRRSPCRDASCWVALWDPFRLNCMPSSAVVCGRVSHSDAVAVSPPVPSPEPALLFAPKATTTVVVAALGLAVCYEATAEVAAINEWL